MQSVLVVAGEASGDAMAAPVVARLGVSSFGLGGPELARVQMEAVADLTHTAALGIGAVLVQAPRIAETALKLWQQARRRRPRAALLVGYSEFNSWLGVRLRRLGTRVLWYGAPQIWAWRRGRAARVRRACDRMALVLPFEEALWRSNGVDARYVGHPALEHVPLERSGLRERLGMTPYAEYLALLPGSRSHELRRHLQPMLQAAGILRKNRGALDARVVLAPSLDDHSARWARRRAALARVEVIASTAPPVLDAFDLALAASGTATLECALANVPPVIVYRTGRLSALVAKRLLQVRNVGLPNIVLGERVFPELLQDHVTAAQIASEAERLLDDHERAVENCRRVVKVLSSLPSTGSIEIPPSERVARMMRPWL